MRFFNALTLITAVITYFDSFNQEGWKIVFANLQSKDYKLLEIVEYDKWNSSVLEALKETLISTAQIDNIEHKEILAQLITKFEKTGKDLTNTFKDIRDEFVRNGKMKVDLFFSNWLFKYASLQEKSNDVIRTILKTIFLDNDDCIKILHNNQIVVKSIIDNSSQNDSSDFKDGIRDRLDNEQIKELAKLLGIREKKEKEYVEEKEIEK